MEPYSDLGGRNFHPKSEILDASHSAIHRLEGLMVPGQLFIKKESPFHESTIH